MKSTEEMIAVMQSYVDGKDIEVKDMITGCNYNQLFGAPSWNWAHCYYRVKEEKYRPFTPEEAVKHLGRVIVSIDDPSESFSIEYVWHNGFCIRPCYKVENINIDFDTILREFRFKGDIMEKCGIKL